MMIWVLLGYACLHQGHYRQYDTMERPVHFYKGLGLLMGSATRRKEYLKEKKWTAKISFVQFLFWYQGLCFLHWSKPSPLLLSCKLKTPVTPTIQSPLLIYSDPMGTFSLSKLTLLFFPLMNNANLSFCIS